LAATASEKTEALAVANADVVVATERSFDAIVNELAGKVRLGSPEHRHLVKVQDMLSRNVMPSQRDMDLVRKLANRALPECEHIDGRGLCKKGLHERCPAAGRWDRGDPGEDCYEPAQAETDHRDGQGVFS